MGRVREARWQAWRHRSNRPNHGSSRAADFPSPRRVRGEWTVDLLEQLPDDGLRYEILDGILIVSPSPIPIHQRAI